MSETNTGESSKPELRKLTKPTPMGGEIREALSEFTLREVNPGSGEVTLGSHVYPFDVGKEQEMTVAQTILGGLLAGSGYSNIWAVRASYAFPEKPDTHYPLFWFASEGHVPPSQIDIAAAWAVEEFNKLMQFLPFEIGPPKQ